MVKKVTKLKSNEVQRRINITPHYVPKKKISSPKENPLFDTENIDDLPEHYQTQAVPKRQVHDGICSQVLEIFELAKSGITINMLMVALYRKFEIESTRKKIYYIVNWHKKSGTLERIAKSTYRLVDNQ